MAFVFYAFTASHGVTLTSLPFTMKVAGWDWQPMDSRPLAWLLTLPVRLLPAGQIPFALNLLSALLAAATLGVLARSIQLLQWDCPPDPQQPWARRLPTLLACALCGLEFSFWQDATAMTGEMMGVLLLALGIRCVQAFRAGKNPRWLDAAAVVWGAGLIENWAMLVLLPIFIVIVAWLPGVRKIGKRFALRMILLGAAALIVFSLQPLANGLSSHSPWTAGEAWAAEWAMFKLTLRTLYFGFWSWHRMLTLTVLLFFLLPILACFVRIKNEASPNVFGVDRAQVWIFRVLRLGLLGACLWLAFDPNAAPRRIIQDQLHVSMPLLTFDYLLALGAAFLMGSLLFASQVPPRGRTNTPVKKAVKFLRRFALIGCAAASVLFVAALAARSRQGMRFSDSGSIARSGDFISRALPAEGGLLLANDALLRLAVEASLAQRGESHRWQTVDLQQLPLAKYRAVLARESPVTWPTNDAQDLSPNGTLQLLKQLAEKRRIFYALPEPGHFLFEQFYPTPADTVSELKILTGNEYAGQPMTPRQIDDNEKFWDAAWDDTLKAWSRIGPAAEKSFPHRFGLTPVKPEPVRLTCRWFSIMLNNWGVELQRAGKLPEAKNRFDQALKLNPDNLAAPLNLLCNSNLLAQHAMDLNAAQTLARSVAGIQQLARLMEMNGAFDDPVLCIVFGDACYSAGWTRQSLQQLNRARQLSPDAITPDVMMAKIYARYGMSDQVFAITRHLRGFVTNSPAGQTLEIELSVLEAKGWIDRTNSAEANRTLEAVLDKYPDNHPVWETVFKAFLAFGAPTNALALLDRMLAKEPDNVPALNNKAAILVQSARAAEALPILDHALALTNLPSIRLNRAIALVQARDFAAAEQAYRELRKTNVDKFSIEYGLAQLAEARLDTNTAVAQYQLCLANAPPQSAKWQDAKARLDALQKK